LRISNLIFCYQTRNTAIFLAAARNFAMEKSIMCYSPPRGAGSGRTARRDERAEALQRENVSLNAEPGDHPIGPKRDIGMVAERLAFMEIGDMNLEHRRVERVQRVENRDGCMGEGGGIDDDAGGRLSRLVDPVDDAVFRVRLVKADLEAELVRGLAAGGLDI